MVLIISKEIQMSNKLIDICWCKMVYKVNPKALVLHQITLGAIIQIWSKYGTVRTLPQSGWPTPKQHRLIQIIPRDQKYLRTACINCFSWGHRSWININVKGKRFYIPKYFLALCPEWFDESEGIMHSLLSNTKSCWRMLAHHFLTLN